jgi:DNA-binding transcriptional LysR family regulator
MDISNLMILFVRTVEQGSFSAAARALSLSPSAVSRQIAALEDHLGVRLLNRSSRRVTLTEEGRTFHERCLRIVAEIDDVQAQMAHMAQHVQGTLRVTATVAFAKAHLLPLFPEFLKLYPELALHLELTDRLVDLAEEGVDVAIRFTEQVEDESLVARRLVHNRRVVVAAPSYLALHGTPRVPEDLLAHNCLRMYSVSSFNDWEFANEDGTRVLEVQGNFEANSADAVYHAALAGLGVARLSLYLVHADLEAGRLVRLLPAYTHEKADILAVYPHRRNLSPKVRAFVDFLAEHLSDAPDWESMSPPTGVHAMQE